MFMLLVSVGFLLIGEVLSECKDKRTDCFRDQKYCNSGGARGRYLKNNCAKFCNLCSGTGTNGKTRGCGRSTVSQGRIVHGDYAVPGAWPWMVALTKGNSANHFCGGSLIHPNWVLTASHCVSHMSPYKVMVILGEHDLFRTDGFEQRLPVRRIITHHLYSLQRLKYDIALLELQNPAKLNKRVQLACLPQRGYRPRLYQRCYHSGWGMTSYPGSSSTLLKQAMLPVVERRHCKDKEGFVCTGFGSQTRANACRGDSGGPLVCQERDGRWVQHGVASFVVEYCKYYTAFTRVGDHIDWIKRYVPF